MKIVFMGTPDFSIPSLKKLIHSDNDVLCAYTRPDKRSGRHKNKTISNFKQYCLDHNIAIRQPETFKNNILELKTLENFNADIGVIVAYGILLPIEVLKSFKYGCINVHPSMLPKYRGPSPVISAILNGEKETGVSIIQLDEGMDSGPVILQNPVSVDESHNTLTLTNMLFDIGGTMILEAISSIGNGNQTFTSQNDSEASYTRKISKSDGQINWSLSASEINRRIKAFYPWPGSHTMVNGKLLKIMKGKIDSKKYLGPGFIKIDGEIQIGTGDGILLPELLQLEGKRVMTADEFSRGNKHLDGISAVRS
ncbi:methionyl-tRNA formyltransferase [Dehalococcoidia bacterium]|nr:methionyl-tRNA formyltransferase [Dehalococcoidia bacterium]